MEMSSPHPVLKKPKLEPDADNNGGGHAAADADADDQAKSEQEEALVALIQHRSKEVQHIRQRISFYQSQLTEAERRLDETKVKLVHLRGQDSITSKSSHENDMKVKSERSTSPASCSEDSSKNLPESKPQEEGLQLKPLERKSVCTGTELSSRNQPQGKPQLVIPDVKPKVSQPTKRLEPEPKVSQPKVSQPTKRLEPEPKVSQPKVSQPTKRLEPEPKVPSGSGSRTSEPTSLHGKSMTKLKGDKNPRKPSETEVADVQKKGEKRKFEQKEHKDLIPMIRTCSTPCTIRCHTCSSISSQHKRKLRSLVLCPTSEQLFVTSALDGVVNLWQVHSKGSTANLLSTTDCLSAKHRRWPEDIAWHPEGDTIFSVYSAEAGESQISILNLNKGQGKMRVSFLEEKPHVRGIINNIVFMPWEDISFVTGGSDHAVVLWTVKEGGNSWKPKALHRSMHSSAVMGVAGMQHKKSVMSAGADKRIIGFDLQAGRADYNHQIDSKCMSILPNPHDFNLFMVQAGTLEKQLRLFDVRARQREVHAFGWKQESSDSQSALINQAWSPDGLYITSGSVDPVIHIFDIRYNSHKPSQSIRAHQKRVFKAVWHHSLPLLISISSDLHIGLHRVS